MLQRFSVNMCLGQRINYHAYVPCNHSVMQVMVKFCSLRFPVGCFVRSSICRNRMKQDAGKVGTVQAHMQFLLLFHRFCRSGVINRKCCAQSNMSSAC